MNLTFSSSKKSLLFAFIRQTFRSGFSFMGPNVVCAFFFCFFFFCFFFFFFFVVFFFFFFFYVFYYVLLLCLVRILHLYSPRCGRFSELTFYGPLNSLLCFQHLSKSRFYLVLYTEEENFQFFVNLVQNQFSY